MADENLGAIERARAPMPGPVIAVVVLIGYYVAFVLVGAVSAVAASQMSAGTAAANVAVAVLVLLGMIFGHALAWQWGRVIPVLALLALLGALGAARESGSSSAVVFVVSAMAVMLSLPVLLSLPSSRRWFALECPRCHTLRTQAASFLYNWRRCKRCNVKWTVKR